MCGSDTHGKLLNNEKERVTNGHNMGNHKSILLSRSSQCPQHTLYLPVRMTPKPGKTTLQWGISVGQGAGLQRAQGTSGAVEMFHLDRRIHLSRSTRGCIQLHVTASQREGPKGRSGEERGKKTGEEGREEGKPSTAPPTTGLLLQHSTMNSIARCLSQGQEQVPTC